jgi:group I intron endonuclease
MNSNYCVYRHRRLDNNKIFYIGISSNNERPYHKNSSRNRFWNNIVNKTNYTVEIICENLNKENAKELEIFMIFIYGRSNLGLGSLCNLTDGGESANGYKHSDETKRKIAESTKRRMQNKDYLLKMKKVHLGSKRSNETKIKMSEAQKGKKLSNETKKKLSEINKNKIYNKNCNSSGLMNPIKLIDLITLNIYNSIKEASEILNIKQSTLTHYILGTRKNKTNLIKLEEYEKNYN